MKMRASLSSENLIVLDKLTNKNVLGSYMKIENYHMMPSILLEEWQWTF
jgi:hypothetical protein